MAYFFKEDMNIISVFSYLLLSLLYASYCTVLEEINYLYLYLYLYYMMSNLFKHIYNLLLKPHNIHKPKFIEEFPML